VRSGFTVPQITQPIAEWAPKNKIRTVATLVSDYGPGMDAEKTFVAGFTGRRQDRRIAAGAAAQSGLCAIPGAVKDARPDAVFVFVPSGEGAGGAQAVHRARAGGVASS
jgi:branched-chain amino acid transport system substrate-binding protein